MRTTIRYIVAATSIITGFMAIRMGQQFDRSMRNAFAMTAEDLP